MAVNHFLDIGAGVIDEGYRGEVIVLLFNFGNKEFEGKDKKENLLDMEILFLDINS